MRMIGRRRQVGGVAGGVAVFWLGFVCGGGAGHLGAAAIQDPAEVRRQGSSPAPQQPDEPAPPPEQTDPVAPESGRSDAEIAGEPGRSDAEIAGEPAPPPEQTDPVAPETGPDARPGPEMQADPPPDPGPAPPPVQERRREFTAGAGLILNFVRPEGESAFEETMARAAEALAASDSDERRRQAEGWSTWRAEEPLADGVILYVSWLDPAVSGADYWIPGILNEAAPTEAQALYETYAAAFADGQILLNLTPVAGP